MTAVGIFVGKTKTVNQSFFLKNCQTDECPPVFATDGGLFLKEDKDRDKHRRRINICNDLKLQALYRNFFIANSNPNVWPDLKKK